MAEVSHGVVSCRTLGWIFDLCIDRHIDPQRILKFVSWSKDHLDEPSNSIDWESFLTLLSNLGNYFSDEQLLDAGAASWNNRRLRQYVVVGNLLRRTRGHYEAMFGVDGLTEKLYPVHTSLREVTQGHVEITLKMQDGLPPCRVFQTLLAGQMAGLPASLGEASGKVHINHTATGATFDVWYQPVPGPISFFNKLITWPGNVFAAARALAAAQDQLIDQDIRIRTEVSRLQQVELSAQETDLRYRLLEHNVRDVLVTMDTNLRIQYVSASAQALTGYTTQEIMDMDPSLLLTSVSIAKLSELADRQRLNVADEEAAIEIEMFHKNGSSIWAEMRLGFTPDASGAPALLTGVISDISERKYFEADLSEREASYQAITATAHDAILTVDDTNLVSFANPAALAMFGYEGGTLEGRLLTELMPQANTAVSSNDQPDPADSIPLDGLKRDGTVISVEASYAEHFLRTRRYTTWIIRDVTFRARIEYERKTLEQQLHAIQRMESIGQLTGGIAHDFNNLLVAINGYADLALNDEIPASQLRQYLGEIRAAGTRAADMTQKLLAFSRRQLIEPKLVDVNHLVKGLEKIIARLLPESIDVKFLPGLQNPMIFADSGQVEQVIINLVVNARDAMPDGGRLTISVDLKDADSLDFNENGDTQQEFAVIRVEDSGTGMDPDTRERIFEPFFTTKPEGEGTGLGMAVAFGIVKQHEGHIEVQSEPRQGTRFDVYLPVADARMPPVRKEHERPVTPSSSGTETILLVEDNLQVRDLARLILTGAGYRVIEARDGVEAIRIFQQERDAIALVIMDVVMPRMGGKEVMTRLRQTDPAISILFTSGYSSGGIHTNFILEEGLDFIQKPYDSSTLRARVRYVLDRRVTTSVNRPIYNHRP